MREPKKVWVWKGETVSKSTFFRRQRAAKSKGRRVAARVSITDRRAAVVATMKAARGPRNPEIALYRPTETVDIDQRVGQEVDKALVSNALAQLEFMLDAVGGRGVSAVVVMHGTVGSFGACARALRKAGY